MQNKLETSGRVIIGMLTPSSNTVVEPYTSEMAWPLFPEVSVHYGRFRVRRIALDQHANDQFGLEPVLAAADLLADAKADVIAWNGTSASWLGFEADQQLCREISRRTGAKSTSAVLSLNQLLDKMAVKRIGLVTPYTQDVQDRIMANYAAIGIQTVAERHAGLADNFSFSGITEGQVEAMCRDVAEARPDAIVILCTNMRGPLVAARLEEALGVPILDSVAFTLWGTLKQVGVAMDKLVRFGKLFGQ